jgi:putative membrane protein
MTKGVPLRFVIRTLVTALALWVAELILDGISVSGSSAWANALTLIAVAVIFGLVNAIIKPIVKVLGCFFYLITLGLIAFVVNALLFLLVDWLAGLLNLPFHVDGFWAAFWGAIIVSVVSWAINLVIPDPDNKITTTE